MCQNGVINANCKQAVNCQVTVTSLRQCAHTLPGQHVHGCASVCMYGAGNYSLVQALPWWHAVEEVAQQLGHEHAKAHRVNQAQGPHTV